MRQHGAVDTAGGLLPFGHLGWGYRDRAEFLSQAGAYIADGWAQGQWIEYVGDADRATLAAELAAIPAAAAPLAAGAVEVMPAAEFYACPSGIDRLDPQRAVAARIAGTEQVVAAGYTGYRAVVDATAMATTAARRAAFSQFEYLIDQVMATQPISALCAYDITRLGEAAAAELVCLHPYTDPHTTGFRLYAEPGVSFALAGHLDTASSTLLSTILARTWPLATHTGTDGSAIRVEAGDLVFDSYRALLGLQHYAQAADSDVLLRTSQLLPAWRDGTADLDRVHLHFTGQDPPPRPSPPLAPASTPDPSEMTARTDLVGLPSYLRQVAAAVDTDPAYVDVLAGALPATGYIAVDQRLPSFPDQDMALLWNEESGWAAALETPTGDLIVLDCLADDVVPAPHEVAEFLTRLRATTYPGQRHCRKVRTAGTDSELEGRLTPYGLPEP